MPNGPAPAPGNNSKQNPLFMSILAAVAFVLLLAGMIYLGDQLETLEERLQYQPPEVPPQAQENAFVIDVTRRQTLYVPVYSHIYARGGEAYPLEVTLSIRNTDPGRSIRLTSVRYYDTKGKLVKSHLDGGLMLGPLETAEFLVEKQDTRGGSGANFIVSWDAEQPVYQPIVEAVMIGLFKQHSISFMSPARPLAKVADSPVPTERSSGQN
jgi:hypothetical protein